MNATEIRQMLKDAIDEFPERDEMLADLGLQTRHSHLPMWLTGAGLLGLGLGLGAYANVLLRQAGIMKARKPPLWTTIGSAVLGLGAGAGAYALFARREEETYGPSERMVGHETRVAQTP
jgi:hypothetical protein